MGNKRSARIAYYERVRRATMEQFDETVVSLRKLKGVPPEEIEKIITDVRRRHEKIVKRLDQHISEEASY